jgi:hypothetical protein
MEISKTERSRTERSKNRNNKTSKSPKNAFNMSGEKMAHWLNSPNFINAEDHSHYDKELFRFCKDLLVEINLNGFISENSQLGSLEQGFEEKAYICGFIKKKYTKQFIKYINEKCNNKMAVVIKSPITKATKNIIVTYDAGEPYSILSTNLEEKVINQMYRDNNISRSDADYIVIIDNEFGRIANDYQGLFNDVLDALKNIKDIRPTRRSWFKFWN